MRPMSRGRGTSLDLLLTNGHRRRWRVTARSTPKAGRGLSFVAARARGNAGAGGKTLHWTATRAPPSCAIRAQSAHDRQPPPVARWHGVAASPLHHHAALSPTSTPRQTRGARRAPGPSIPLPDADPSEANRDRRDRLGQPSTPRRATTSLSGLPTLPNGGPHGLSWGQMPCMRHAIPPRARAR